MQTPTSPTPVPPPSIPYTPGSVAPAAAHEAVFPNLAWDKPPKPTHVGLALGGGAARGLAHIGVLEVLEEEGIPIHMIVGCSAGSVVGALFAAGISARRLHGLVRHLNWHQVSALPLPNLSSLQLPFKGFPLGLLDLDRMVDWLAGILGAGMTFAQLDLPFAAVATDIVTGEVVIMNDGEIAPAVRASCAVPGVFTPYRRNGRLLVDGGVIANLPIQITRMMGAEYVIGVDLLPAPGKTHKEPENIIDVSLTSLYALIRASQSYGTPADCTIEPAIQDFSLLDLDAAEGLIVEGRAAAQAMIPAIRCGIGLPVRAPHA